MSCKVKARLALLQAITTHEERRELDKIIEEKTHMYCDEGVDRLTDNDLLAYLEEARARITKKQKKKQETEVYCV